MYLHHALVYILDHILGCWICGMARAWPKFFIVVALELTFSVWSLSEVNLIWRSPYIWYIFVTLLWCYHLAVYSSNKHWGRKISAALHIILWNRRRLEIEDWLMRILLLLMSNVTWIELRLCRHVCLINVALRTSICIALIAGCISRIDVHFTFLWELCSQRERVF